jgi:hypothetical protein
MAVQAPQLLRPTGPATDGSPSFGDAPKVISPEPKRQGLPKQWFPTNLTVDADPATHLDSST